MPKLTSIAIALAVASAGVLANPSNTPGSASHSASSPLKVTTDIAGVVRLVVPTGWEVFAKKGIDTRQSSSIDLATGEKWSDAIHRWAANEGLKLRVDTSMKRVYLDKDPSAARLEVATSNPVEQTTKPEAQPQPQSEMTWSVLTNDLRLETTLERWTKQAGYALIWDADRHILITAEDTFVGSFEDALDRVFASPAIRDSDYPLEAVIYNNNPPVVRVTGLGEQSNKE